MLVQTLGKVGDQHGGCEAGETGKTLCLDKDLKKGSVRRRLEVHKGLQMRPQLGCLRNAKMTSSRNKSEGERETRAGGEHGASKAVSLQPSHGVRLLQLSRSPQGCSRTGHDGTGTFRCSLMTAVLQIPHERQRQSREMS